MYKCFNFNFIRLKICRNILILINITIKKYKQTVDLYEGQNMAQVFITLINLSSLSYSKGFEGPSIGVKLADKNTREFDEQKLREGRNVIGLQVCIIVFDWFTGLYN